MMHGMVTNFAVWVVLGDVWMGQVMFGLSRRGRTRCGCAMHGVTGRGGIWHGVDNDFVAWVCFARIWSGNVLWGAA